MRSNKFLSIISMLAFGLFANSAYAQFGIFDKTADWGDKNSPPMRGTYKAAGKVSVKGTGTTAVYDIYGNGDDIWDNNDEGFFVYTEKAGSWSLTGKVSWVDAGGSAGWAKAGVMIRDKGLVAGSRHYWIELRGDAMGGDSGVESTNVQWRTVENAASGNTQAKKADGTGVFDEGNGLWLRVTRIAAKNLCYSEWSMDGKTWTLGDSRSSILGDTVAYGLAISNHTDNDQLANATWTGVALTEVTFASIRSFASNAVGQGKTLDVKIELINTASAANTVTVTETVPTGWTISNISNGGAASGNIITWSNVSAAVGTTALTYTLTVPTTATGAQWSGKAGDVPTVGGLTIPVLNAGVGIFDAQTDVGDSSSNPGTGKYDAATKTYTIEGSGSDIWNNADGCHYLFKEIKGDFSLKASIYLDAQTGDATWAKAGPMVRQSIDGGSVQGLAMIRASGQDFEGQYRNATDGASSELGPIVSGANTNTVVEIERLGNNLNFYYYTSDEVRTLQGTINYPTLQDPVLVGLAVTAHNTAGISYAEFTNVQLTEYPFGVARTFSSISVPPGASLDAKAVLTVKDGATTNFKVTEAYPSEVKISNLKASAGTAADDGKGTITWSGTGVTGALTLTYTATFPSTAKGNLPFTMNFEDGKGFTSTLGTTNIAVTDLNFAPTNLGIFDGHMDIGTPGAAGKVGNSGDNWGVVGSGDDIWNAADSFHYLYKKVTGDFKMTIEKASIGPFGSVPSSNDWQKMGIMARQSLTSSSAYVFAMIRKSDQFYGMQWRETDAGAAASDDALLTGDHAGTLILERKGDTFTNSYVDASGKVVENDSHDVVMTDPIYIGIAVTAHQAGATSIGYFSNVKFEGKAVPVRRWMLY